MKPRIIFKKKDKADKDYYVYVKYADVVPGNQSDSGKKKKIIYKIKSLNISVPDKDANWGAIDDKSKKRQEKQRLLGTYIKASHPNADNLNTEISQKLLLHTHRLLDEREEYKATDVIKFIDYEINKLWKAKKYGTANSYKQIKRDLELYCAFDNNRKGIDFTSITNKFVSDFEIFLETERGLAKSTRSVRMYKLKAIYELAIKQDVYLPIKNVFYKQKFAGEKTKKPFLLPKEVELLLTTDPLTNPVRGFYESYDENSCLKMQLIERARLMFIFQIFSNGMRVSDVLFLRWNNLSFRNNVPKITYKMYKTGEEMSIKFSNNIIWILSHFINSSDRFEDEIRPADKIKCVRCSSTNIISGGNYTYKGKKDTYRCKECNRVFRKVDREARAPEILTNLFMDLKFGTPYYIRSSHSLPAIKGKLQTLLEETGLIYLTDLINEINYMENLLGSDSAITFRVFFDLLSNNRIELSPQEINDCYISLQRYFEGIDNDGEKFHPRGRLLDKIKNYYRDGNKEKKQLFESRKKDYVNYLGYLNLIKDQYLSEKNKYLIKIFKRYSNQEKTNSFIFQMLDDADFKDVNDLNNFHNITAYQYLKYMNKSKRYNALLKKIREQLNFEISLSTHTARYTFTYLMVDNDFDVYTISKLLGHSSIAITDRYLPRFLEEKANSLMKTISDTYDVNALKQKSSKEENSVEGNVKYSKTFIR